jgi:3-phosphoshikimate 1-carboxyvinyltransferase
VSTRHAAVRIHPFSGPITGTAFVPRSKPHMQRAILLSLLTNAPSIIAHPAWSSESRDLYEAVRLFGLDVAHQDPAKLILTGVGRSLTQPALPIQTAGSAFNFRTAAALACLAPGETVIEGNASMRARPVLRYLNFIDDLGARWDDISDAEHLRIRVRGGNRLGGTTAIDTAHSSQALTAALLIAPLADRAVRIECDDGGLVGEGYIDLTLAMMREQGAVVSHDGSSFAVTPSVYQSRLHLIASDFTALSYLAGAVAVADHGELTVTDYHPSSLSSEKEFLTVLRMLGVATAYDPVARSLHLWRAEPESRSIEIDGSNIPTVVPTLAAIAPFVEARVTVRNVAHVNYHKCPRVSVMIRELSRLGCRLTPVHRDDGLLDGFTTTGRQRPAGGVGLTSHGDHRIFMSLAIAALGARSASVVDGAEQLGASFPDFLNALAGIGPTWDTAGSSLETVGKAVVTERVR